MLSMEGALWKWTNYMSGWQLRWFVLDVGVLSYYKSQDDIELGSRGSVKMGCCEVSAQPNDPLRINLKIPPDQYIYVKATTPAERQQWLVALGSSKACLTQGSTPEKPKKHVEMDPDETLEDKMSEMRVCKNILLQQIDSIKKLCTKKEEAHEFQEAATLLSATCDAFLTNLSGCVQIAERELVSPLSSPRGSEHKNFSTPGSNTATRSHRKHGNRASPHSPTSPTFPTSSSSKSTLPEVEKRKTREAVGSKSDSALPSTPNPHATTAAKDRMALSRNNAIPAAEEKKEKPRAPTIFSTSPNRFEQVQVLEDGGIPTKSFLLACNSILPIFDVLGPTAFAPVKLDIGGNIKKLMTKYENDPKSSSTLQSMISQEIRSNTCAVKNSATDALLWLKRALQFTNAFLQEIDKGERELVVVASNAYSKTLRRYHGWMVRGVFAMAVKAVPYWKDFVKALGTTDSGIAPESDVLSDIKEFTNTLSSLIGKINEFYSNHKLDNDNTV